MLNWKKLYLRNNKKYYYSSCSTWLIKLYLYPKLENFVFRSEKNCISQTRLSNYIWKNNIKKTLFTKDNQNTQYISDFLLLSIFMVEFFVVLLKLVQIISQVFLGWASLYRWAPLVRTLFFYQVGLTIIHPSPTPLQAKNHWFHVWCRDMAWIRHRHRNDMNFTHKK